MANLYDFLRNLEEKVVVIDDPIIASIHEYLTGQGFKIDGLMGTRIARLVGEIAIPLNKEWTAFIGYDHGDIVINFRSENYPKKVCKIPLADPRCFEKLTDTLLGHCTTTTDCYDPHKSTKR